MADYSKGQRNFTKTQPQSETIVGQYMPKHLRVHQSSEIRNSHFTLGYEPTKPNMVTTKNEQPETVTQKWQVSNPVKATDMPAAKQNFSYTNNSQIFHGNTSLQAAQSAEAGVKDLGAEGQMRVDLAKRLRQSNIPFNNKEKNYTTTNEESYPQTSNNSNQFSQAEKQKIIERVKGLKPNFSYGLEPPIYSTTNMQNMKTPGVLNYANKSDIKAQVITNRQHNFNMSYNRDNQMLVDQSATPFVTNLSKLREGVVVTADCNKHSVQIGHIGIASDFLSSTKLQSQGYQRNFCHTTPIVNVDKVAFKKDLQSSNFNFGHHQELQQSMNSYHYQAGSMTCDQAFKITSEANLAKERFSKPNFAIGTTIDRTMANLKTSHQIMQQPGQKEWDAGNFGKVDPEFKQMHQNGKLDSINLQTGHTNDYQSEAKSKFFTKNLASDAMKEGKKIAEIQKSINVPFEDSSANRNDSMQTVAMNKDYIAKTSIGQTNEITDLKGIATYMAKHNFNLGSHLPEHHKIDMSGYQRSQFMNHGGLPQATRNKTNLQQSGAGIVNPASAVSAGNIGGPKEKYDFKTVNQERMKWIQPQAIVAHHK